LVFGFDVSKMSSRRQAIATMCVHHMGEAEAARSPRVGIIIVAERVCCLLSCKVLPLTLELCLDGL
jgi:hypothetical protein